MILVCFIFAFIKSKFSNADQSLTDGWHKSAGHGKEMWAGVFRNNDNLPAYCADADLAPPWDGGSYKKKDLEFLFRKMARN
ncbi:MAG: hypothetical protein QM571_06060 [Micrococcaceae bacterium]